MIDAKGDPDKELEDVEGEIAKYSLKGTEYNEELRNIQQVLDAQDTIRKQVLDHTKQTESLSEKMTVITGGIKAQETIISECTDNLSDADIIRAGAGRYRKALEVRDQ